MISEVVFWRFGKLSEHTKIMCEHRIQCHRVRLHKVALWVQQGTSRLVGAVRTLWDAQMSLEQLFSAWAQIVDVFHTLGETSIL